MKGILIFTLLTIVSLRSFSQPTTYSKVIYDSLTNPVQSTSVVQTFDNGFLVAGANQGNGFLMKIDSTGNILWNKTYDVNISPIFPNVIFNHIISTYDSNYVLCGGVYNNTNHRMDALCLKIDPDGNLLWSGSVTQAGYYLEMNHVEQTADSGFVIVGYAQSTATDTRIFVAKLDAGGNLQWKNMLTAGNNANYGISVKQAADGNYFLAGFMENCFSSCLGYTILLKLDSAGTFMWAVKYSNGDFVFANDFEMDSNGFVFYMTAGPITGFSCLMRTDLSGNILWSKGYQMLLNSPCGRCNETLHRTTDGGYIFVSEYGVSKTDSTGEILFHDNLTLMTSDVIESRDKGYFIIGNGPLLGVLAPPDRVVWPQIGIIKTDSVGNNTFACVFQDGLSSDTIAITKSSVNYTSITAAVPSVNVLYQDSLLLTSHSGCVDFLGSVMDNNFSNAISMFPNPTTDQFTIYNTSFAIEKITVYDVMGKEIFTQMLTTNGQPITIDASGWSGGVYFVTATDNKGREAKAKLIKLR